MTDSETSNLRTQLTDIYRDYRNVAMSRKYYECRRVERHRFNVWYEIVMAFGTSGTVGTWAFWQQPAAGQQFWIAIGILVSIGAIAKPILKVGDDIERLAALSAKYAALQIDFEQLIFERTEDHQAHSQGLHGDMSEDEGSGGEGRFAPERKVASQVPTGCEPRDPA